MQKLKSSAPAKGRSMAFASSPAGLLIPLHAAGEWALRVIDENGNEIDAREWTNLVTTAGKNLLLASGLTSAAWYLGLISGTPTVADTDTPASHAGWTEVTAYTQASRPEWVDGSVASGSVSNSGSVAVFDINANGTTIGGAGLFSVATKGGTTGTLYAVGAFTGGNLTLNSGSQIQVTASFSV